MHSPTILGLTRHLPPFSFSKKLSFQNIRIFCLNPGVIRLFPPRNKGVKKRIPLENTTEVKGLTLNRPAEVATP